MGIGGKTSVISSSELLSVVLGTAKTPREGGILRDIKGAAAATAADFFLFSSFAFRSDK